VNIQYGPLREQIDKDKQLVAVKQRMTRDDWIDVTIALTIAFLMALLIISYYPSFNKTANVNLASQTTAGAQYKPARAFDSVGFKHDHKLSGVFVSDDLKVAMIDEEFFRLGDVVDGMKIVMISSSVVQLKNKEGSVMLRMVI